MARIRFEELVDEIRALDPDERKRLRSLLDWGLPPEEPKVTLGAETQDRFAWVAERWRQGELTRNEAASELQMSRWDFDALLRERHVTQDQEVLTPDEIEQQLDVVREMRPNR